MVITSSGLASIHTPSTLGTYREDGTSNGYISYKNNQGEYLYFKENDWWVSRKYNILTADFVEVYHYWCIIHTYWAYKFFALRVLLNS